MAPEDNPADEVHITRERWVLLELLDAGLAALEAFGDEIADDASVLDATFAKQLDAILRLTSATQEAKGFLTDDAISR